MLNANVMTDDTSVDDEAVVPQSDIDIIDIDGEPDGHHLIDACLSLSYFYNTYNNEQSSDRES